MANDERNFRSAYYEKVGFKSVEEKKSIEMLLKDKTDCDKLKQFCVRYHVPTFYRNVVWHMSLEILPGNRASHEFVLEQKRQEYDDLLHCAKVIRIITDKTTKPQIFLAMWMIYKQNINNFGEDVEKENDFMAIVETLLAMEYFEEKKDVFWIATKFFDRIAKYEEHIPKLKDFTYNLLEREDQKLYTHLYKLGAFKVLPLERWFRRCFASVLNENALAKMWDKIVGGANYKTLAYLAVGLLIKLKHRLVRCDDVNSVLESFDDITEEETSDIIVNFSIYLCYEHGIFH